MKQVEEKHVIHLTQGRKARIETEARPSHLGAWLVFLASSHVSFEQS